MSADEKRNDGSQEELSLGDGNTPFLRVSPGMAVSSEHLEKLTGLSPASVDGVGPMEVWATFGRVERDGSRTGGFKKKRVGWDEARRLQELVREVGWSPEQEVSRSKIESIAALPNGDILSAAEAVAEVDPEARVSLAERCAEVHGGRGAESLSLVDAVAAASDVRNDDIRAPREVIEMTLWLMGHYGTEGSHDLLAWFLGFEEGVHGLTGVVTACDDFYRTLTGLRPSSTLQSRIDRASALRFRIAVTHATPKTPALLGGYGNPLNEPLNEDPLGDTLHDARVIQDDDLEPSHEGDSEEAQETEVFEHALVAEVPKPTASVQEYVGKDDLHAESEPATVEDRVLALESQLLSVDEKLDRVLAQFEANSGTGGSRGSGLLIGLAAAAVIGGLVFFSICSGDEGKDSKEVETAAPRVGERFPGVLLGDRAADSDASEEVGSRDAAAMVASEEPSPAPEGERDTDVARDGSVVAELAEALPPLPEEEVAVLAETQEEVFPVAVEGVLPEGDEPLAVDEEAIPEAVAEALVESEEAALEEAAPEEAAPEKAALEEAAPEKAALEEAALEGEPEEGRTERVAERYGLGFKATHRLTKRSKLYRFTDKEFVEVTALPGGDALVDECIVAEAPRSRYRHKIYRGYQTIYLSCAGEMKVICEQLGCEPQQRCVTAAGWVKPCKKRSQ